MIAVGDATGMTLGRFDGILFLILFAGYIGLMIKSAMKARAEGKEVEANDEFDEEELKVMSYPKSIIYIVGGGNCNCNWRRFDCRYGKPHCN